MQLESYAHIKHLLSDTWLHVDGETNSNHNTVSSEPHTPVKDYQLPY